MKIISLIHHYIHYDEDLFGYIAWFMSIISWLLWFIGSCYYDYWLKDFFNYFHISDGFGFIIWSFICLSLCLIMPCILNCPLSKLLNSKLLGKLIGE